MDFTGFRVGPSGAARIPEEVGLAMTRWLAGTLVLLMAAVSLVGLAAPAAVAQTTAEPLYIGLFAPFTGENAEYGRSFRQAIDLFVTNLNAAGGVDGRPVEIIAVDDRSDPREAANIAQRFAGDRRILATIGSFTSTAAMAAAPIFERAGVVQISPTSSHPDFTKIGSYMFRNTTIQSLEAPEVARFVVERLGARRIAVAYRQDDWGLSASGHFEEAARGLGADIVLSEGFIQGERDFRPFITRIRSVNPDAIHVAMFYADAAVLAQQLAQAGVDVPVITATSLYHPEFLAQGGRAVEGYYVPTTFYPDSPEPVVREFVDGYRVRYGDTPSSFAAQAYDSVGLIVQAVRTILAEGGELTRQAIRDTLYRMPVYQGVTGPIKYDENGDVVKGMTWLTVRDGQFEVVQ